MSFVQKGLEGSKASLFYHVSRIRRLLCDGWPGVSVLTFVENVASMSGSARGAISRDLGVGPVGLDTSAFVANRRPRLYWLHQPPKVSWTCGGVTEDDVLWLSPKASVCRHERWLDKGSTFMG